eukprot:4354949-Pyramimonas_sp.AAC.1
MIAALSVPVTTGSFTDPGASCGRRRNPKKGVRGEAEKGGQGGSIGVGQGREGKYRSSVDAECSLGTRLKVKNIRGIFKVCCTSDDQRRRRRPRAPTPNFKRKQRCCVIHRCNDQPRAKPGLSPNQPMWRFFLCGTVLHQYS